MFRFSIVVAAIGACLIGLEVRPAAQAQRDPGVSNVCGEFGIELDLLFGTITLDQRPDEGWAWVDPARKRRQATGIAHNVHVAASDTPANHNSHDVDFLVRLDPGQEDLLSIQPDSLAIEWESGISPLDLSGDGANPIFPKWAWPSAGDRVWVDGNWIHDCGHPQEGTGFYQTEIHPARAVASMRDQAAPLPGTGLTPVPVTLTDLYISGNGGYAPNQLNCGPDIILGPYGDTCGYQTPPADESYKTTPINDTNFSFDVCLPPRPPNAVFTHRVDVGPRNNVQIAPVIALIDAAGFCIGDSQHDQSKMMHVTVPLKNTATPPASVYTRRIYAGWLVPPDPVLPRRVVTLNSTDLHEDHDLDPGDGELTFWWLNVNRAESAWRRLSDHATGNMDDYDSDDDFGDGIMNFTNATFDFYLRHGQSFSVDSVGFEQDCFDHWDPPYFGYHQLDLFLYRFCYQQFSNFGAGDPIASAHGLFSADDVGSRTISGGGQYDVALTIDEVETTLEDTSYLSIQTACTPAGEVALVGQPLTCATRVNNGGTGLPRQAQITNRFSGPPLATVDSATWSIPAPFSSGPYSCSVGSEALCRPDTVPVAIGVPVNVSTLATPTAPGLLTERAEVTTASTDPILTDNTATTTLEVFRSVTLDVLPGDVSNRINLNRNSVTIAILTTADFDATTIDPLSACFGDAEAPAERSCAERHGRGHVEDVDKDRRPDMVLHFDVEATGIDFGDTAACVIARTRDGIGLYGCDAIIVQ